jgi:peptidoglycan hydrolase-like protein with peptidoglycan-binding domain
MVPFRTWQILALGALLAATPAFATRTHRAATSGHSLHHKGKKHKFTPGQRQIEPERATEIQNALIREHYLTAPASGQWDSSTEAAMQKYQADHGWQTKLTPDSRALIKLGLGPHDATPPPSASVPPISGVSSDDPAHPSPAGTLAATNSIQN